MLHWATIGVVSGASKDIFMQDALSNEHSLCKVYKQLNIAISEAFTIQIFPPWVEHF